MSEPHAATDLVDGRCESVSRPIIRYSPHDNRVAVSAYEEASISRLGEAVQAANRALPAWAAKTPMDRARVVAKFLEIAREEVSEVAALMRLEAGKPIHEAMGEVMKGIQILEWALGIGHRLGGITRSGEGGAVELMTRARPLGVVVLITPWNFPWAVPIWKIAPALIAGNTVVYKGSEHTPAMNTKLALLLHTAGVPNGVFNLVQGGRQVVETLVIHPDVRAVSFTGSTPVGRAINQLIAGREHPIPYQAELGGNNAVYVSQNADLDLAADGIMAGKFGSAGQRCTATQRVVAHAEVIAGLTERLNWKVEQIQLGLSDDPSVKTMGPLVTPEHRDRVLHQYEVAIAGGNAESLWGKLDLRDDLLHGNYLPPLGLFAPHRALKIWHEEIFGPVLVMHRVFNFEEGIRAVNDCQYGFAASIYSEDRRELQQFRDGVEAGMIHLNEPTAGGEPHVGFGGWKATGIGPREMDEGVDFFVRRQTIFDSSSTAGGKLAAR